MEPLSQHLITRFISRYLELKGGRNRTMNVKRMSALNIKIVEAFFLDFQRLKAKYNVEIDDIYNIGETGF
jgi:hypothetical protein